MLKIKLIIAVFLSLLLISCQTTHKIDNTQIQETWQKRQNDLNHIDQFQVNGSIAYFSGKNRVYGRFLMTQNGKNDYSIKLTSPVGTNLTTINVKPNKAELIDQNGDRYTSRNIEKLMQDMTSITIPFNLLQNWLKGLSNSPEFDRIDNQGRLSATQFKQNNLLWQLAISDYKSVSYQHAHIDLPIALELTTQQDRIRLKISRWLIR